MTRLLIGFLLGAAALTAQSPTELVLERPPFAFYSAFWPNLHHLLWAEAWAARPVTNVPTAAGVLPEPLIANLTADEKAVWDAAVKYYDDELADLHPLFEFGPIRKIMMMATGDLRPPGCSPIIASGGCRRRCLPQTLVARPRQGDSCPGGRSRCRRIAAAFSDRCPNGWRRLYRTPSLPRSACTSTLWV